MMYKVLLLKRKKGQLHEGAELKPLFHVRVKGGGTNVRRFVSSFQKTYRLCVNRNQLTEILLLLSHPYSRDNFENAEVDFL